MRADFGSCLDHLSDEMSQMNTKIGRITRHQSRLGGFTPSPSFKPVESSSDGGDDDGDDAYCSKTDDKMTPSLVIHPLSLMTKTGNSFVYESNLFVEGSTSTGID